MGVCLRTHREKAHRVGGGGAWFTDHAKTKRVHREVESGGKYRLFPLWDTVGKYDL